MQIIEFFKTLFSYSQNINKFDIFFLHICWGYTLLGYGLQTLPLSQTNGAVIFDHL